MTKLLRLRDYILLSVALSGDILNETSLGFGILPSAIKNVYGFVPRKFKRQSLLSGVSRLLSVGDIRRVEKGGRVFIELTSLGEKKFKRKFPIFNQEKKWDGKFTVVIFDIPEQRKKDREILRRKLIELGFGMLQKSIYISPYHFEEDLREFLIRCKLSDEVFVLSAKNVFAGDLKLLAQKVWPLLELNEKYKKVVSLVVESGKLSKEKKKNLIRNAYSIYLSTLLKDPLLPYNLLPDDWCQRKALKLINQAFSLNKT